MIPRILHHIWVGPNNPSPLMAHCFETNSAVFPAIGGWEIRRWSEHTLKAAGVWEPFLDDCIFQKKWVHVTELARWLLLERFGGIYLDCDVEAVRGFGPLLHNCLFVGRESAAVVNGAVIGAEPGHRLIRKIIEEFPRDTSLSPGALGPAHLTKMIEAYGAEDCNIYPASYFYQVPWQTAHAGGVDWARTVTGDTWAIHYYAGSWVK